MSRIDGCRTFSRRLPGWIRSGLERGSLPCAFFRGAGVEAAFASRVLFQAGSVAVFFLALRRARNGELADFTMRHLFTRSLPFALNRALGEIAVRLPSLVLPGALGLAASGVFDTANRVRSTLGMTMSASIAGMMPSFARQFAQPAGGAHALVGFSLKYMCLGISAVATVIGLAADWIVTLLFGSAFAQAILPLQILAWTQVIVAVDAVLQQVMLAAGREYPTVRHSAAGVGAQLALILVLASAFGLPGVAVAVLLSAALTLALNLRHVVRHVAAVPIGRFVAAPLAAAGIVAGALLLVHDRPFGVRALAAVGAWALVATLLRLVTRDELRFIRQLASLPRPKRSADS